MKPHSAHRNSFSKNHLMAAFSATLLLASTAASAAPLYTITQVPGLPGFEGSTLPFGINNLGQVVGYAANGTFHEAFFWDPTTGTTGLGTLAGDTNSTAHGLNDHGQVVGDSVGGSGRPRAFLWDAVNGMRDLGSLPNRDWAVRAYDINNNGQIVGESTSNNGNFPDRAFLWEDGLMTDLGALCSAPSCYSNARSVNDDGQVVGMSFDGVSFRHAVGWQPVTGDLGSFHAISDLGDLPGGYNDGQAFDVNDRGQVVGRSSVDSSGFPVDHAFLWEGGIMTDLGDLPGGIDASAALGINNLGQVVGYSPSARTSNGGFLWTARDGMQELLDLLVDPAGLRSFNPADINDAGQIVGSGGGFSGGVQISGTFVLTPVPGSDPDFPLMPVASDGNGGSFTFPPFFAPRNRCRFIDNETVRCPPIFIDPVIAIGYDYIVNSGPNIASVLLPTISSDDGLYDIYLWDGDGFDIFAGIAEDGVEFFFDAAGVNRFRVLGIDEAALLDPANPAAFVTGLTFVSEGTVDMSMTPVTFDTDATTGGGTNVPEPMAVTLLGAGLVGLGWMRRRKPAKA